MILILDNYDSFVHNLARYVEELGHTPHVVRNDAMTPAQIEQMRPSHIIISPGPCSPTEAGISVPLIHALHDRIPILGVCLGHQSIAHAFGMAVIPSGQPMHGKTSRIHHHGHDIFAGLPSPFSGARYHSLIVEDIPDNSAITITARDDDGTIMALRHKIHPTFGVQFHPESVLTEHGHTLLKNFLQLGN